MKSDMKLIQSTFFCLGIFFLTSGTWAQEASVVSVRTMQLGGDGMPELFVRVANEKEPVKLSWLTTQPTEPMQVLHDGNLKLLSQAPNAEGKMITQVAKSMVLPPSSKEVLLLAWNDGSEVKYVMIQDQFLNAKFNDWLVINASVSPVALKVGDDQKPIRVDAGKSLVFSPKIVEGKGVEVIAQTLRKGEMKTFLSSYWPAFAKQRTMIIFYDDGEKMRARRISDRFLVKKEETKEP